MILEAVEKLSGGNDLNKEEMRSVMEEIMAGKSDTPSIVSFLTALNNKGETVEELTAAVIVMRRYLTKIQTKHKILLDTCGTGGDRLGTFNISTVVAFVVSGCGIIVAKHGNRSVSSNSGSADILEALGVDINLRKEKIEECLDKIGIAFLFAQNLHPAMRYAAQARKQIGRSTIFNLLGPLSNPAGTTHQLVGVFNSRWVEPLAKVLANLGTEHALVVHGEDGLDEVTITGPTLISEEYKGKSNTYRIAPEDFGITRAVLADLAGKDASFNAKILIDILKGKDGPKRDIVLLNAAAAIFAADKAKSIRDGLGLAALSIDSGKALGKFMELKEFSHL